MIEKWTKRSDKKKNIDKIAASLAKNPLQTQREVEKDTWISRTTVGKAIKNLDKTWQKDNRIVSLTDKDLDCINLWVEEIRRRLSDKSEISQMKATEISQVIRENTARYTLFRWTATDDKGWLKEPINTKDIESKSIDELKDFIQEQIKSK